MIIISIIFVVFAITWRVMPVLNIKLQCDLSTDEYFHLYYIDLIKKNNNKLPKKNIFALGGSNLCTYPSLFHILMSYLPYKFILNRKKYFSFIFDLLSILIFSYVLTTTFKVSIENVFFIIAIYLLHPALTFCSLGPRSFSITPRAFSQSVFFIGFSVLLVYLSTNNLILLQLSLALFAISAMSSKFTVQFILFVSIFMSVIMKSYYPIIYMFNVIFWCLIFGRKNFLYQIKGQINHSIWYLYEGYKFIKQRWEWNSLFLLLKNFNLRQSWQIMMFTNPITRVLLLNLPMFFFFFFMSPHKGFNTPQLVVIYFVYSSMIVSFVTNFSIFRIFGEPERYVEYAIGGFLFLLVTEFDSLILYFSLIHVVVFLLYSRRVDKFTENKCLLEDVKEVQEYFRKSKNIRTICTSNNETYLFCGTDIEIVVGFFSNNINSSFSKYFYSIYPDVNYINFSEIIKNFNVERIVLNKNRKESSLYNISNYKKVLENNSYIVYEVCYAK